MANQKNQTSNEGGRNKQSGSSGTKPGADLTGASSTGNLGGSQTSATGTGTSGIGSTGSTGSTGSGSMGAGSPGAGSTGTSSSTPAPRVGSTSTMSTSGSSSGGGAGAGTAVARSLYDQAKETAGQAYEVAAEKATNKLEEQKTTLSGGLSSVADSVRKVSDNLRGPDVQDGISKFTAEYSDVAARKIEDVANYFDNKSVREMYSDVENFARRNPAVFVGGAFALGLLLSRFLKSGAESNYSRSDSTHDGPISTASDEGSGQGVQGITGGRGITPGASIS
jgi:hypothetical protein